MDQNVRRSSRKRARSVSPDSSSRKSRSRRCSQMEDNPQDVESPMTTQDKLELHEMVGKTAEHGTAIPEQADTSSQSQEYFDATSQPMDKGKGKARDIEEPEVQIFRLMDLPTEVRLEIYRACLTRPYKILLSKAEDILSHVSDVQDDHNNESTADSSAVAQPSVTARTHASGRVSRSGLRAIRPIRRAPVIESSPTLSTPQLSRSPSSSSSLSSDDALATFTHITTPSSSSQQRPSAKPKRALRIPHPASPDDPLIINILRTSKQIYKEARSILYSENVFDLNIRTAVPSLAALHQRSRRHIRQIELEIPTYTEILEGFSEIVRLSLRYCSGLRKFVVHTPFTLPNAENNSASNAAVYANGFDILRWLPQQCEVVLVGRKNEEIEAVVRKHLHLAKAQDKCTWARMQIYNYGGATRNIETKKKIGL